MARRYEGIKINPALTMSSNDTSAESTPRVTNLQCVDNESAAIEKATMDRLRMLVSNTEQKEGSVEGNADVVPESQNIYSEVVRTDVEIVRQPTLKPLNPKSPPLQAQKVIVQLTPQILRRYEEPMASNDEAASHTRNNSADNRSGMYTYSYTIPRAYRLLPTSVIREKKSYFMLTIIAAIFGTGGYIISTSSFTLQNIVTWVSVTIFLYLYQRLRQYMTCVSNSGGYSVRDLSGLAKSSTAIGQITLLAQETIMIECIPMGIEDVSSVVEFPAYCRADVIDCVDKTYMRLTNLYQNYKLVIPLSPLYYNPNKSLIGV